MDEVGAVELFHVGPAEAVFVEVIKVLTATSSRTSTLGRRARFASQIVGHFQVILSNLEGQLRVGRQRRDSCASRSAPVPRPIQTPIEVRAAPSQCRPSARKST